MCGMNRKAPRVNTGRTSRPVGSAAPNDARGGQGPSNSTKSRPTSRPNGGGGGGGGGRAKGEPPQMRVCYICGRQFGSRSLRIHEPQCMKKWEAEQEKLEPDQRRPRPKKPDVAAVGGGGGGGARASVDAANEAAYEAYDSNLSPCPNCGRTFNSDSLPIHLRSCRPGSASKPIGGRRSQDGSLIPGGGGGGGGAIFPERPKPRGGLRDQSRHGVGRGQRRVDVGPPQDGSVVQFGGDDHGGRRSGGTPSGQRRSPAASSSSRRAAAGQQDPGPQFEFGSEGMDFGGSGRGSGGEHTPAEKIPAAAPTNAAAATDLQLLAENDRLKAEIAWLKANAMGAANAGPQPPPPDYMQQPQQHQPRQPPHRSPGSAGQFSDPQGTTYPQKPIPPPTSFAGCGGGGGNWAAAEQLAGYLAEPLPPHYAVAADDDDDFDGDYEDNFDPRQFADGSGGGVQKMLSVVEEGLFEQSSSLKLGSSFSGSGGSGGGGSLLRSGGGFSDILPPLDGSVLPVGEPDFSGYPTIRPPSATLRRPSSAASQRSDGSDGGGYGSGSQINTPRKLESTGGGGGGQWSRPGSATGPRPGSAASGRPWSARDRGDNMEDELERRIQELEEVQREMAGFDGEKKSMYLSTAA